MTRTPTLCHGWDAELGASRFCGNCEETMPTYEWDPADYARSPSRIETLVATAARVQS